MSELRDKTVRGFFWAMLERFGTQAVSFGVSLILARLLTPSDYGAVALLLIFIAIAEKLADAGFGSALVQKKDAEVIDFNTVFCISMSVSIVLYVVLFLAAPQIARFFRHPELVALFRVQASILLLMPFTSVQGAEISRRMLFKLGFRIGLTRCVISSSVGVACAVCGLGPWALVWMTLSGAISAIVIRLFVLEWRPSPMFSASAALGLWRYGWKIALSSLLDNVYSNLYGFLIGRYYTSADLAFVNKGRSVPSLAMNSLNGTIGTVAFPALAQLQSEPIRLREAMRKMMKTSTVILFPAMVGLAACAPSLIPLLFGDQWMSSVIYVQFACLEFALYPFHTINLQGLKAQGRSDWYLVLEVVKKLLGLALILASVRHGVFFMMLVSACVGGPLCVFINAWPNKKLLSYPVWMQIRDVVPAAVVAIVMGAIVFSLNWLTLPCYAMVPLQILTGAVVYMSMAFVFKLRPLMEALGFVMPMLLRMPILSRIVAARGV